MCKCRTSSQYNIINKFIIIILNIYIGKMCDFVNFQLMYKCINV